MGRTARNGPVAGRKQGRPVANKNNNNEYEQVEHKPQVKRPKARLGNQYQTKVLKETPVPPFAKSDRSKPILMSKEDPFVEEASVPPR